MQKFRIRLLSVMIFLAALNVNAAALSAEKWEAVETKSGIQVFERWVSVSKDLRVRERKGVMQVQTSWQEILRILKDPARAVLWMEHVEEAWMVRRLSDNIWYSYTRFSVPWPFEARDMVSLSTLAYNTNGQGASIDIRSKGEAWPLKPNTTRIDSYRANWEIHDLGRGNTSVTFTAISYTAPEYPRMLQDPVLRGTFIKNLINLRNILELQKTNL